VVTYHKNPAGGDTGRVRAEKMTSGKRRQLGGPSRVCVWSIEFPKAPNVPFARETRRLFGFQASQFCNVWLCAGATHPGQHCFSRTLAGMRIAREIPGAVSKDRRTFRNSLTTGCYDFAIAALQLTLPREQCVRKEPRSGGLPICLSFFNSTLI